MAYITALCSLFIAALVCAAPSTPKSGQASYDHFSTKPLKDRAFQEQSITHANNVSRVQKLFIHGPAAKVV